MPEDLLREYQQLQSDGPADLFAFLSSRPETSSESRLQVILHDLQERYRMIRLLGQGAFGRVYLAVDIELERQVAIKVPLAERFQGSSDADAYLAEARTVASLNHPHIVPVYDMGRTPES